MKNFLNNILILVLVSSCAAPVVFLGASGVAVKKITEERSIGSSIDDMTLWTAITKQVFENDLAKKVYDKVSIKVYERRVILAGSVNDPKDKLALLRIVWSNNNVKEVIDEIKINQENDISFTKYTKDTWITTQIKTKLLLNKMVQSANFSVETIDGVVYLIGIARSNKELSLVTEIAGTVKGVVKVVSYVRLT